MALTAAEQYLLELTNRARLDPQAEAVRYGIGLNDGLTAGTITAAPKRALAPNAQLETAAERHSQWMLDTDSFSHTGQNGSSAGQRIQSAGYTLTGTWAWGENLAWWGTSGTLDLGAAISLHHEGLFRSSGHRVNTLSERFQEVGIAQIGGRFTTQGSTYNASMTTLNFARHDSDVFVTGVAYTDTNKDRFYSMGEGRTGVVFRAATGADSASATSAAAGGYAAGVAAGAATDVLITHGTHTSRLTVDTRPGNAKIDLVGDSDIFTSADTILVSGRVLNLTALGSGTISLTGNTANNTLTGGRGNNVLDGAGGEDSLYGGDGRDNLLGGGGRDSIWGGAGHDILIGGSAGDRLHGDDGNDTMEGGTGHDQLFGGRGNDLLSGFGDDDLLRGGDGDDRLFGGGGVDKLEGGNGNDSLDGGSGADSLWGDQGHDTLRGGADNDALYGGNWQDTLYGDDGNDRLWGGTSSDQMWGGTGNDTLWGEDGHDKIHGDAGADVIYGGTGNDQIFAGADADRLFGDAGNDRLDGSAGNDTLTGGLGADRFVLRAGGGRDTITDFTRAAGDTIGLDDALFAPGTTFAQVLASYATVSAAGVTLALPGNTGLLVQGVDALSTSDFFWV